MPLSREAKRSIRESWANQITLTSTEDGLHDFILSFLKENDPYFEEFEELIKEAEIVKVGSFENGDLLAYCWGPQQWNPNTWAIQKLIEDEIKAHPGCEVLTIERGSGRVDQVGYLADFGDYDPIAAIFQNAA